MKSNDLEAHKKAMIERNSSQWQTYGEYFGYPECCVAAFRMLEHFGKDVEYKLNGTGYIPCSVCNEKSEEELLETIAKNRKCPTPFPEDGM